MSNKRRRGRKAISNGSRLDGTGFEGLDEVDYRPVEQDDGGSVGPQTMGFKRRIPVALARALFRKLAKH